MLLSQVFSGPRSEGEADEDEQEIAEIAGGDRSDFDPRLPGELNLNGVFCQCSQELCASGTVRVSPRLERLERDMGGFMGTLGIFALPSLPSLESERR